MNDALFTYSLQWLALGLLFIFMGSVLFGLVGFIREWIG